MIALLSIYNAEPANSTQSMSCSHSHATKHPIHRSVQFPQNSVPDESSWCSLVLMECGSWSHKLPLLGGSVWALEGPGGWGYSLSSPSE